MSWKKKLGIIVPVCCMVAAAVLGVLLCREWTTPDTPEIIEAPFTRLEWGMTLDEAYEVLADVGIEKVAQQGTDNFRRDCELWTLTPEQAELLGYTHPGDLVLSENEYYPVYVGFANTSRDGIIRLVSVAVMVEADASLEGTLLEKLEYAENELEKTYGEPVVEYCWRYVPQDVETTDEEFRYYPYLHAALSGRTGPKEFLLCYDGSGYSTLNYGGNYSAVYGDFNPTYGD